MPTCPLSERKSSNWLFRWVLRCMAWLILSSLAGLTGHQGSPDTHNVPTGNTMNHSLLKMDLCSSGEALIIPPTEREKIFGTLHQSHQGITKNTVACLWLCLLACYQQGYSRCCSGSVKHALDFRPRMLLHHLHQPLHLHIPSRYVCWTFSHWMVWIISSLLISIPR